MSDNKEFLKLLKSDLEPVLQIMYTVLRPAGDVKTLPSGSTTIDFAYSIHSAVGNKMVGARVNGKLVPIEYQIQNGDRIEILTSPEFQRSEPGLAKDRKEHTGPVTRSTSGSSRN